MTTTNTLMMPTGFELDLKILTIAVADVLNFATVDVNKIVKGNSVKNTAEFVYGAGLGADSLTVLADRNYNPTTKMVNCNIVLEAQVKKTVTETGAEDYKTVGARTSWYYHEDLRDMDIVTQIVQSCFGIFAQQLEGANDVPTTKVASLFDTRALANLMSYGS